jgi:hypothetical protein
VPALGRAQGGIRAYPAACTNLSGPECIPNTGGTVAAPSRGTYKQATALEGFRVRRTKSQVVVVSIEVQ